MRRWWSKRSERGAIAVLVSVVLVGAALPLAGLGYSAYVRGATAAELQRAADSGALAGAASIPLVDPSAITSYLASVGVAVPLLPSSPPADPRVIACKQAVRAAQVDNGFSKTWATPAPNGTTSPSCTAKYTPDLSILAGVTNCISGITGFTPLALPTLLDTLLGLLGPIGGLLRTLINGLIPTLESALPSLLQPGIEVSLTWNQRGPLDALNPGDDGTAKVQTANAVARRRFKNVVVLPTTTLPGTVAPIPINATVGAAADLALDALRQANTTVGGVLTGLGISGCGNLLGGLITDLEDLVNPPPDAEAPTVTQVLDDAFATATPLLLLRIPPNPTAFLNNPFLDFVPVCIQKTGGTFTGLVQSLPSTTGCLANAPGAFRATLVS